MLALLAPVVASLLVATAGAAVSGEAPLVTSVSPRSFFFNAEPTLLLSGSNFDPTATEARCLFTYTWMGTKFAAIERGQRCNNSANGLGDAQLQGRDDHGQQLCEVPLYSPAVILNATSARCVAPRFSFHMYEQNLRNVLDIEQGLETLVAVGLANDGRNFSLNAASLAADRGALTERWLPWVVSTYPLLSAELDRRPYTEETQPASLVVRLHESLLGRQLSLSASCGGHQILAPVVVKITTVQPQLISVPLTLESAWSAWTARGTPSPGTGYGGSTCTGNGTGCTPDAQSNLWECIGNASLVDATTRKLLQSEPVHLALAHGTRAGQVTISHSRRSIMLDDEPFLPVGWFAGNEDISSEGGRGLQATIDYMESLAEQGVNMLMLYGTGWQGTPVPLDTGNLNQTLALLDAAWGVGVRVQLCMPGLAGIFRVDDYTPFHPPSNRSDTFVPTPYATYIHRYLHANATQNITYTFYGAGSVGCVYCSSFAKARAARLLHWRRHNGLRYEAAESNVHLHQESRPLAPLLYRHHVSCSGMELQILLRHCNGRVVLWRESSRNGPYHTHLEQLSARFRAINCVSGRPWNGGGSTGDLALAYSRRQRDSDFHEHP